MSRNREIRRLVARLLLILSPRSHAPAWERPSRTQGAHRLVSKLLLILLVLILVYTAVGLAFHIMWQSALASCREARAARGEFVEPEVFWWGIGLAFDVTFWPVYIWANVYHDGTPFATPCTHLYAYD